MEADWTGCELLEGRPSVPVVLRYSAEHRAGPINWVLDKGRNAVRGLQQQGEETAGACFSDRVVSDAITRLRPGLGGRVHPGPQ